MKIFTRKFGIILMIAGVLFQFLNIIINTYFNIDIDILGAMIFVLGLVITIAGGNTMKNSSKWLTRKNGLWLCVIGVAIEIIIGLLNLLGLSSNGGGPGAIVFILGIIVIIAKWKK